MRGTYLLVAGSAALVAGACSVYDSSLLVAAQGSTGGTSGSGGGSGDGGGGSGGTSGSGGVESGGGGGTGGAGGGVTGGTSGCQHATYPKPPSVTNAGGNEEIVAVQSNVDLGDSPIDPVNPPTRYRTIGFDLDGVCTSTTKPKDGACKVPSYGIGVPDGPNGQDNALGATIQFIRERVTSFSSDEYSKQLRNGAANVLIHVTGYNGLPDDDQVRVETMVSAPFNAFDSTAKPAWDGQDVWPIASDSVINGSRSRPKFVDDNGYVTGGKVVVSLPDAALRLQVGLTNIQTVYLDMLLHGAFVVCEIVPATKGRWRFGIQNCTMGGRWKADDLVHQLSHFPDPFSTAVAKPLCRDNPSYPGFKQSICSLVDVYAAGQSGPTLPCDALSMGVTFDTEPGELGDVYSVNALGELCPSITAPSDDSCTPTEVDGGTDAGGSTGGTAGTGGTTASGGSSGAGGTADSGAGGTGGDAGPKADASAGPDGAL